MRAVLLGTDFIKDVDGSFKTIETNTNIQIAVEAALYFDEDAFDSFLSTNSINEIVLVTKNELNDVINDIDLDDTNIPINNQMGGKPFNIFIKEYCERNQITYSPVLLDNNSMTVPHIEDSENKLIIRVAYDVTALIDDTYARDNWEFLKLMNDTDSNTIPKTYINDTELGFDSIGSSIRDNGEHPNYLIKKRFTPADNRKYPKLLKISNVEQLNTIKNALEADEYLQEYVLNTNDLLNNRLSTYRSVDLIYGSDLNVFNLWCIQNSNTFELDSSCDFDDNNELQYWERPKYVYKFINVGDKDPHLSGDENTMVLLNDGTKITLASIQPNDVIKTVSIPNLPINELDYSTAQWSSSYSDFIENYEISTASLNSKNVQNDWIGFFYEIETTDGIIFSDVSQAAVLCKVLESGSTDNYIVKFKTYAHIDTNDTLLLFDTETSTMVDKEIQSVSISYGMVNVYTTDFEQLDIFLTMEESNNSKWGILTHNYSFDCRVHYYWPACYSCSSGYYTNMSYGGCCRCEGQYLGCYSGYAATCYDVDQQYTRVCDFGGFCNDNKSDKRLKKNIKYIKTLKNGINIYQFEFKSNFIKKTKKLFDEDLSGIFEGVLAQELIGTKYEIYVKLEDDGYYSVDYDGLNIKLLKNVK